MKSFKSKIKKTTQERINASLPPIAEFDKLPTPKKVNFLPITLASSSVMVAIAIIVPVAISSSIKNTASDGPSINNSQNIVPKGETNQVYDEYAFDEYYCEADNSYIRLYENGYFIYDDDNYHIAQPYSEGSNLIIVQNLFVVGDPDDASSYKVDTMFLNFTGNTIISDSELSIYTTGFCLNNKSFILNRKSVDKNAKCRYTKIKANNLLFSYSLNDELSDVDNFLVSVDLSSYADYVSETYKKDIKFTFPLSEINAKEIIATFISKRNNSAINSFNCRFDNSSIVRSANLDAYELIENDKIDEYTFLQKIESTSYPYRQEDTNKGLVFTSYDDAISYANSLKPEPESSLMYKPTIDCIASLSEEDFANCNLVLSNVVIADDSEVSFSFKDVYLKNEELIIVLNKTYDYSYGFQITYFDTFAFMIDKTISFDSIVTIF